ncbi:MAG: hypothetical protein K2J42_05035 [Muribaculaceae bacterium]|nr:hypothetical protein [Muribaculaceae bacterium]
MKTITFRKNWNNAIARMPVEIRRDAVIAVYDYLLTGCRPDGCDKLINDLIDMVAVDLTALEIKREKARRRREIKRLEEKTIAETADAPISYPGADAFMEYMKHPALYMFDGFMSYIGMTGCGRDRLGLPDDVNIVEMMCHFRQWVIENGKVNEITKLTSFMGLFKHALPEILTVIKRA